MTTISDRQGKAVYWYLAMTDIADRTYVDEFNHWYDDIGGHVNDHMVVPGINRAWRTQEIDDPHNFGPHIQEFNTIYQCDRIDPFEMKWIPLFDKTVQKEDRRKQATKDWIKVLFQVLNAAESDDQAGKYWVREEFDVNGSPNEIENFETYCASVYLPKVLALSGVHRSWQLRADRDNPYQRSGHSPWDYVNVFEVDSPDDLSVPDRPDLSQWATRSPDTTVTLKRVHVAKILSEMYASDTDPSLAVEWKVVPATEE